MALGDRVYHGEVGGAACAGCHGANATGSPLGPNLTSKKWLWSDGSYAGILKTIREGVAQPKEYRSPMPPMGGAQLTQDQKRLGNTLRGRPTQKGVNNRIKRDTRPADSVHTFPLLDVLFGHPESPTNPYPTTVGARRRLRCISSVYDMDGDVAATQRSNCQFAL